MRDGLAAPTAAALQAHVSRALWRYWPRAGERIDALAVARRPFPASFGPLSLVDVPLPPWGADAGVDAALLVPREACDEADPRDWKRVDWWLAAFLLLEAWHERAWEAEHGAIHSYSFRLRDWDARVWQHAWVNRIALFLRSWAADDAGAEGETLFGPLPQAEIDLTHDVDAVRKTASIRFKQTAFLAFNALRMAIAGRLRDARSRLAAAWHFLFSSEDWWMLDAVVATERRAGWRSTFNVHAGAAKRGFHSWLFDPGYDTAEPRLLRFMGEAARDGWRIGLHPSHAAWRSASAIREERERLQSALGRPVESCRQHWLRFGWRETWAAQAAAGLKDDTTLMFNDRPGFRNAAALRWAPWNAATGCEHALQALPSVLMDSHFYDYASIDPAERRLALRGWIAEVHAVGGQAAVLWHPHTLTRDYGWGAGFAQLLAELGPGPAGAAP